MEMADIKRELGVSSEEARVIQEERAAERLREYRAQKAEELRNGPTVMFLEDPADIVDRVALQMGIEPEEAAARMASCDRMAIATFREGNDYPRSELN